MTYIGLTVIYVIIAIIVLLHTSFIQRQWTSGNIILLLILFVIALFAWIGRWVANRTFGAAISDQHSQQLLHSEAALVLCWANICDAGKTWFIYPISQ